MSPKKQDISIISVIHPICCGLDVHKKTVAACMLWTDEHGRDETELKEFGTLTDDLLSLKEWLLDHECPVVVIESTGVYWHPVHNVLEHSVKVELVNARDIKNMPGRKTDMSDSKWLACLCRHGLIRSSFIPPKEQRQWRDLTRSRKNYVHMLGDLKRHAHTLFQKANIKIDSVVSDLFGTTGRNLMKLLCSCESPPGLAQVRKCLHGALRAKSDELHRSVQGFFGDHHRTLLRMTLDTIDVLEGNITFLDQQIAQVMKAHDKLLERFQEVHGIKETAASAVLAEAGATLANFSSAAAFASWIGVCPGNNESAGKRHSGRSRVHCNHLKTLLVEVAWAAIKKKGSYYKDKYYRIRGKLGPKKAIVAIGHRIAKAIYHIIKYGSRYQELGDNYLVEHNKAAKLRYIKKQAELLGHELVPVTNQLRN